MRIPWLHRHPSNRRIERKQVLDVKLRSIQARSARMARGARILAVLFGATGIAFGAWKGGEWTLDKVLFKNPAFAIQRLDVQTDGSVHRDWIVQWSGVDLGDNLFALDLVRVRRDLKMVALIEDALVERVLPNTLRLRVQERESVARIVLQRLSAADGGLAQQLFFLDRSGFIIQPLPLGNGAESMPPDDPRLPTLLGFGPFEVRSSARLTSPRVLAALELIAAMEHSPLLGIAELARIDVGLSDCLMVTTSQGSQVCIGLNQIPRQLRRWRVIHDEGAHAKLAIAFADLSVSNNIPVRWIELGASPPAPAPGVPAKLNPAESLQPRKKNV